MQRWMETKVAKMKRDGLVVARLHQGGNERWGGKRDQEIDLYPAPKVRRWYVSGRELGNKTPRGLPQSYGPFDTSSQAFKFGKALFAEDTIKTRAR